MSGRRWRVVPSAQQSVSVLVSVSVEAVVSHLDMLRAHTRTILAMHELEEAANKLPGNSKVATNEVSKLFVKEPMLHVKTRCFLVRNSISRAAWWQRRGNLSPDSLECSSRVEASEGTSDRSGRARRAFAPKRSDL